MADWDPATYLRFAGERARPFVELTERIDACSPRLVVDLGCGPGQLTATLAARWPSARVVGLDSSPEMVERAQEHASSHVSFRVADLVDWLTGPSAGAETSADTDGDAEGSPDVIVSNATLQWVPEHRSLLPALVRRLAPLGWLAFQVPGNFAEPSHRLLHELAADRRFAEATRGVERPQAFDPDVYLADLATAAPGLRVDAWETTYLHVLTGEDPVFDWISGTGARPVLQSLGDEQREPFIAEYKSLLREAYPPRPNGTVLPFRRVFVVVHRVAS